MSEGSEWDFDVDLGGAPGNVGCFLVLLAIALSIAAPAVVSIIEALNG